MSTEKEQQSHGTAWTIALMLLPVLYVLSVGPTAYLIGVVNDPWLTDWWRIIYKPVWWLDLNVLDLHHYWNWWYRLAAKP